MSNRILINLDNVLAHGTHGGNDYDFLRSLFDLADELNDALPGVECTFVHLDTGNFLAFNGPNNVRRELTKLCPACECVILRNETFCPDCLNRLDQIELRAERRNEGLCPQCSAPMNGDACTQCDFVEF